MEHKYIEGCKDKCGSCNLCCLAVCEVCGLFEGALTTHCCGESATHEQSNQVYAGKLNFRGGIWIEECSEHTPVFFRKYSNEWDKQHGTNITAQNNNQKVCSTTS